MKLTKGKKAAMVCFVVFLAFMAVCTVVAKGVYASGLPRVTTAKPYSGSIAHVITVGGTVMQGEEYGFYMEPGLRVAVLAVDNGDTFRAGDPVFRIEPGDLSDIVAQRRLEIAKLELQMAEAAETDRRGRQSLKLAAERAGEDYDREAVLADARIWECRQVYEAAQRALSLYDQYLAELSGFAGSGENGGNPPDGAGEGNESGAVGEESDGSGGIPVVDPEQQYNRQEKRLQLEQNVITAVLALEEAERQKEDKLRDAARVLEDAKSAMETGDADVDIMELDIVYQKKRLQRLEELLEAEGWVYADISGRVTDNRLKVGERTQDEACIIYALDDGERILSAVFSEEQAGYLSEGTQFEMKATRPDGSRVSGMAWLEHLENGEDGVLRARLSFDMLDLPIGQAAELTYRMQTDVFNTCVSVNCVYQEGENQYYVYTVEEQPGILGSEWRLRKVAVRILDQNDTVMAIQSAEINSDTRIVSGANKTLEDGAAVRVVQ